MKKQLLTSVLLALGFGLTACQTSTTLGKPLPDTVITQPPASSDFTLRLDTPLLSIYPGETTSIAVTLSVVSDYSGSVTLAISGLPKGITAQSKTISVTGSSVSAILTLAASSDAPITQSDFMISAQGGDTKIKQSANLLVYPLSVKVPGNSYNRQFGSKNVDPQGNLWLGNPGGFVKVIPDLKASIVNTTEPACGVTVGQDGGIWAETQPYVRLDPVTATIERYSSPDGSSGCAGMYQFDAQRRAWSIFFGINRLDLANQVLTKVPGTENMASALLVVKDDTVWLIGDREIDTVNTNTLALKKYPVGTSFSYGNFFPRDGKLYFADNGQLATFDPSKETISRISIGQWRVDVLYGLDKEKNAWVKASTNFTNRSTALLRISPIGNILKTLPDLVGFYGVTPNGSLWFSASASNDFRVAYIAP